MRKQHGNGNRYPTESKANSQLPDIDHAKTQDNSPYPEGLCASDKREVNRITLPYAPSLRTYILGIADEP
jgi:hypothetical protein